jgi:Protein of unknown function (DUF3575)
MKGILLCIFLATTMQVQCQKLEDLTAKDKLFRINFTSLLDPIETNISVGYEKRFTKKFSYSMDIGYIYYSSLYQDKLEKISGIILRPAIRYYTSDKKPFYIELELHYKTATNTIKDWVGRKCVNNVSAYQEYTSFKIRKNIMGFNVKAGYQTRLTKNNRYWLEPYIGLGIKYRQEQLVNEPNSCYLTSRFLSNRNLVPLRTIRESIPSVPGGIRLLIKL